MWDGLEMDRRGDPHATFSFDLGTEADEPAAAGTAAGFDVVVFDPVVDDVGADPEHGGDLPDGELVVCSGVGCVRLVDVS